MVDVYLYTSHATIGNDRRLRRYVTALFSYDTLSSAPRRTTLNLISLITENRSGDSFAIMIQNKFARLTNDTCFYDQSLIDIKTLNGIDIKNRINII